MRFFSSDKRLQEIYFQNLSPPSKVKWSAPERAVNTGVIKLTLLGRWNSQKCDDVTPPLNSHVTRTVSEKRKNEETVNLFS